MIGRTNLLPPIFQCGSPADEALEFPLHALPVDHLPQEVAVVVAFHDAPAPVGQNKIPADVIQRLRQLLRDSCGKLAQGLPFRDGELKYS